MIAFCLLDFFQLWNPPQNGNDSNYFQFWRDVDIREPDGTRHRPCRARASARGGHRISPGRGDHCNTMREIGSHVLADL